MKSTICMLGLTLSLLSSCQTNSTAEQENVSGAEKIIFKDNAGNILTSADLENSTGQVNYEIMGNETIDPRAQKLHDEARALGQAGKYDSSIEKLEEAIQIQPTWAYPTYDLAYTYLLKGDFDNALKYYEKTDQLEPKGFFTSKTAVYTLQGEDSGKFPKGLYTYYMQLEWAEDAGKKLEIAKAITEKVPGFAPAWKELANLLEDNTERLNAIEKGLSAGPDAETKGILIINKAIVRDSQGKKEEAKKLLGNLVFSPDVTTGNLELAKFALKSIAEK